VSHILVAIERPEEYEDVCDELVFQDAIKCAIEQGWHCKLVAEEKKVMKRITEQDVIDGWARWGDGTSLNPGFAAWLAEELNRDAFVIEAITPPAMNYIQNDESLGIAGFTTIVELRYKQ
jgi:hypothetical protein